VYVCIISIYVYIHKQEYHTSLGAHYNKSFSRNVCVCVRVCVYVYAYVYVYVCAFVCNCECMCVHMYMYIYINRSITMLLAHNE